MSAIISNLDIQFDDEQTDLDLSPFLTVDNERNITVKNLRVNHAGTERITAKFRHASGKDYKFLHEVMNNRDHLSDIRLLSNLCVGWGDDETVTMGELLSEDFPIGSLLWLIETVVLGELLRRD